jgi:hypothetical protein
MGRETVVNLVGNRFYSDVFSGFGACPVRAYFKTTRTTATLGRERLAVFHLRCDWAK